jgi:hypothetical protein
MTSRLENHAPAHSRTGSTVNPDVSALFDELAVSLQSDSSSLSEARRVAWLRDKVKFEKLVAKGAYLHELMIAELLESTQSCFTVVQDLQTWGYSKIELINEDEKQEISDVLDSIGLDAGFAEKHGPNFLVGHTHKHPTVVEGMLYPATYALLCQAINPSDGVIVAYDNITAQNLNKESGFDLRRIPNINHWSDVAYLQWLSKADQRSNLRYVLRYIVLNDLTRFVVEYLGLQSKLVLTGWPGTTYNTGSVEFNALLGSPNGSGVAYLLAQHKTQLGHKTIDKITVFKKTYEIMLLFDITDVEGSDDADVGIEAAFVDVKE